MTRKDKEQEIAQLKTALSDNQASFLVGYKGLTVAQLSSLRRTLHAHGGAFKVSKVTLMKIAMQDAPSAYAKLEPYLKDQVGLVFSSKDTSALAKTLQNFAKDHDKLTILAGVYENSLLDKQGVHALATLPSKEVLLAQLCGVLQAPITNVARTLHMVPLKLVLALKAIEDKKTSGQ